MEAQWKLNRLQSILHILGNRAQITALYIGGDVDLAGLALTLDHIRNGADTYIRDVG